MEWIIRMKKISQKLKWLKGIIHKCVTKNKDKSMYIACMGMMLFVEGLENKVKRKNTLPKKNLLSVMKYLNCQRTNMGLILHGEGIQNL